VKTELQITGMTCQRCRRHVEEALRQQRGVSEATVALEPGTAVVEHEAQVSAAELCAAVVDAGYQCQPRPQSDGAGILQPADL
jgi:copper chaperone CopZ